MNKAGVDSPDGNGCDDMLSLLRTDVIPGARDGEFLGVVIRIKDDDDEDEDYDATVACVLCLISFLSSPPGFFMLRAMISALGAASHSLSCPSPSWSPHRNRRKNEAGSRAVRRRPPRPVLILGFVPGGLIGVVSRSIGCAFVWR